MRKDLKGKSAKNLDFAALELAFVIAAGGLVMLWFIGMMVYWAVDRARKLARKAENMV